VTTLVPRTIDGSAPCTVMLPSTWVVADPMADAAAEAKRTAGSWATLADARRRDAFVPSMQGVLEQVRRVDARLVALLSLDTTPPLAASLLVAQLPDRAYSPAGVELEWAPAGRPCTRVSLPIGPAVVTEREGDPAETAAATVAAWEIQIAVPHPVRGGVLIVGSSPLAGIGAELRGVILAIASTLRWLPDREA
jgi:hypothetical protein